MIPSKEEIRKIKDDYPTGCRVILDYMNDVNAPPIGTKGTVLGVDSIGSIVVNWDGGKMLNVVYGIDSCHCI